ncbi:hypothetical protein [Kitasatospora sp. NPDC088548]|uniref:DUF7507 domain-containing protein n=1 Tax=Kitasatospora sp. NPDC088548 TaxID=3364075 RepID=UPI00381AB004
MICATIDHETVCLNFEVTGSITLKKRVVTPGPYTVGKTVRYSCTVTNAGSTELHGVLVNDDRVTSVTCDATTLAPGSGTTCHGTYTITKADAEACKNTKGGGDGKGCAVTDVAVATGNRPAGSPGRQ